MRARARKAVALGVGLALVGTASAAFALWTAGGAGSGAGATGSTVPVTLSPGTPGSALYPGGQADIVLTVTNPNASPMHLAALQLDTGHGAGGFAIDAGHAGCSASALSYLPQSNGGTGWSVPPRVDGVDGTLPITLPNALDMAASAANACQGATITVYLEAG